MLPCGAWHLDVCRRHHLDLICTEFFGSVVLPLLRRNAGSRGSTSAFTASSHGSWVPAGLVEWSILLAR